MLQIRPDLLPPNLPVTENQLPVTYLFVNPRLCLQLPSSSHYWTTVAPRTGLTFSSVRLVMDFVCDNRYIVCKHHQLVTGHARHTTIESS